MDADVTFTVKFPQNAPDALSPDALDALMARRREERKRAQPIAHPSASWQAAPVHHQAGKGGHRPPPPPGPPRRGPARSVHPGSGYPSLPPPATLPPNRRGLWRPAPYASRMPDVAPSFANPRLVTGPAKLHFRELALPVTFPIPMPIPVPVPVRQPPKAFPSAAALAQRHRDRMQADATLRRQQHRGTAIAQRRSAPANPPAPAAPPFARGRTFARPAHVYDPDPFAARHTVVRAGEAAPLQYASVPQRRSASMPWRGASGPPAMGGPRRSLSRGGFY
jgi:hypothetical protein